MSGRWLRLAAELNARGHGQNGQNGQRSEASGVLSDLSGLSASSEVETATPGTDPSDIAAAADRFEERAAIVEYDGGIARSWAEAFARMCNGPRPDWVLRPRLWTDLIDAAGRFLDQWGATAADLGWEPVDLFGASSRAPLARIDQQGLVFFLRGGARVTAMTADIATIAAPSGFSQVYRRRLAAFREAGTQPIWDLIERRKGESQ
jgi:hypothetical protein